MGYSPEAYAKAELVLSEHRRALPERLAKRSEEIYQKFPRIKEIEEEITLCGTNLARMALSTTADSAEYEAVEQQLLSLENQKKTILAENGYAEDYLTNAYICPLCRDTGYNGGIMCNCLRKLLSEYDIAVPAAFADFDNFRLDLYSDEIIPKYNVSPRSQMKNVLDYCKNYAKNFSLSSDNILMYGGAGLGKTFLCNCIAKELSNRGFNVILSSAYNIFEIISKNKFNYKADLSTDIDRYYECDLLIMDDLGTEFSTEYTISALFDIINSRLTRGKPTIINANLTVQDMSNRYSDRIVSRLLTFRHLMFLGNDIRAMN